MSAWILPARGHSGIVRLAIEYRLHVDSEFTGTYEGPSGIRDQGFWLATLPGTVDVTIRYACDRCASTTLRM